MRHHPLSLLLCLSLSLWILGAKCGETTGPEDEIGNIEFDMLAYVLRSELGALERTLMLPNGPPGCLSISSTDDTDSDGVPDAADFVYSETGCAFPLDNGTGTTAGTVHVTDPGSAFGFMATLQALETLFNLDNGQSIESLAVSGQRHVEGSPDELTLTQSVQFSLGITGRSPASGSETWQAVFTPAQGAQAGLGIGMQLPDGGTVVAGGFVFIQSGTTATLDLSTPTPIRWDPECGSPFPTSGEVHAQVVSGGPSGYVKIVWSSCGGEAAVDFVGG
jgi:hypothetical protein